jgi:hypothetical protein
VPQRFTVTANPESVGFDAYRLQRIDTMLAGYVREGVIPNGVSFVAREKANVLLVSKPIFEKGTEYTFTSTILYKDKIMETYDFKIIK